MRPRFPAITTSLTRQRPFEGGIVHQWHFVGFGELQRPFQRAADVVGAGAHSQVVGDGIEAIDESFWKADKDGTFVGCHKRYLGTQNRNRMWKILSTCEEEINNRYMRSMTEGHIPTSLYSSFAMLTTPSGNLLLGHCG